MSIENKNQNLDVKQRMNELVFIDEEDPNLYQTKSECYDSEQNKDVYCSCDIVEGKPFKNFLGMSWDTLEMKCVEDNHL